MATKKTSISFTAEELEMLYSAMNRLSCYYAKKSETLKKICDKEEGWEELLDAPDYFQKKWAAAGVIRNKIYKAEERINA